MTGHQPIDLQALAMRTLLVLLAGLTATASAQSLGDVARRESDRRKEVASGRAYTDDDLQTLDPPQAQPPAPVEPAAAPAPPAGGAPAFVIEERQGTGTVNLKSTGKAREKRDEQYWRKLAQDLRRNVAKANAQIAAQQARLVEIDAGPQTPTAIREREVISGTLARLQKNHSLYTEELTRFLTRAQLANIPEDWYQ